MYKQTGTDLNKLSSGDIKKWISSYDTVLADCDGVLWVHNDEIENSSLVINKFKDIGKRVFLVTNNSTKTRSEFLQKALNMNFNITEEEIVSAAYATARYLTNINFQKTVYLIASNGVAKELDLVNIKHTEVGLDNLCGSLQQLIHEDFTPDPNIGAVIVGFDEYFSFPKMFKAATYLSDPNCLFISTNKDERFPMPNCVVPGTGSIVSAIETCAERKSITIGKPNPYICETIINDFNIKPERTLMIGDRCNTDILLGYNCNFQTLLVGTGIHNLENVAEWKNSCDLDDRKLIPDVFLPKLGDLLPFF